MRSLLPGPSPEMLTWEPSPRCQGGEPGSGRGVWVLAIAPAKAQLRASNNCQACEGARRERGQPSRVERETCRSCLILAKMPIHEPNKCLALEPLSAGAFSKAATDKRNAGLEILTASSLFALKGHLLSFLERPHATPPAPPPHSVM
jgi:hypothetical protein